MKRHSRSPSHNRSRSPSHDRSRRPVKYIQRFKENYDEEKIKYGQKVNNKEEGEWIKGNKTTSKNNTNDRNKKTRLQHSSIYKVPNAANGNILITNATTWHHSNPSWKWRTPQTMYETIIPTNELNGLRLCVYDEGYEGQLCYQTFVLPPFESKITKIERIKSKNNDSPNRVSVQWLRWLEFNEMKNRTKGYPFPSRLLKKSYQ